MHGKYRDYLKELDLSLLPEVHALSSGLKALAAKVSGSYTHSLAALDDHPRATICSP